MIVALDSSSAESAVSEISLSPSRHVRTDDGICSNNCLRDDLDTFVVSDDAVYFGVN